MNALSILRAFAHNSAWSNLRLYRACARLTAADLAAPRTSFFPSLRATLEHVLLVDLYYLDALEGAGRGRAIFDDPLAPLDLAALHAAQAAADARLVAFAAALPDDAALDAVVAIQRRDHVQREKVGDVLMHLYQHQIHHRGQVHAMLAGTPVKPPQLDEFFLAEEAPLRAAELRDLGLAPR